MTQAELSAAGFEVDATGHAKLARFVACLLKEGQRLNLTGVTDETELWRRHVCDSLALWPLVAESGVRSLMDVGSGGGLPGLPLACVCPTVQVTLLDATRKKVEAIDRMVRDVGLDNARAAWGRAETLAHDAAFREQYDVATARAVAALPTLVELAAGFVRVGGPCWFFKTAAGLQTEAPAAESAARRCGLLHVATVGYQLPGEATPRILVGYRKTAPLDAALPRPPGRAAKKPL